MSGNLLKYIFMGEEDANDKEMNERRELQGIV